jgi:hypothetical protein
VALFSWSYGLDLPPHKAQRCRRVACFVVRYFCFLWGWVGLWCLVPCLGCGGGWFFGLGCFYACVGMGGVGFWLVHYVGCMLGGMGRGWAGILRVDDCGLDSFFVFAS